MERIKTTVSRFDVNAVLAAKMAAARRVYERHLPVIHDYTVEEAPVDTGHLRNNITEFQLTKEAPTYLEWTQTSAADYSAHVRFGTTHNRGETNEYTIPANPFDIRALDRGEGDLRADLKRTFGDG